MDSEHAALGVVLVVFPDPGQNVWRPMGLRGAGLGRLLSMGSGEKRGLHAVAGATAYLHSVMVQERKDVLKVWNLALIGLAFALTLFGTFITRSGVISSAHPFNQSGLGGSGRHRGIDDLKNARSAP
jgi:hypothetical protein